MVHKCSNKACIYADLYAVYPARASRVLLLREAELGAQPLADQVLLHLAADREREAVHEAHVARHLVMRNLSAAKVPDLRLGGDHALAQADARADGLAVLGVGDPDHRDVEHCRMPIEEFLDFPR